jgi:hypothetical protein
MNYFRFPISLGYRKDNVPEQMGNEKMHLDGLTGEKTFLQKN